MQSQGPKSNYISHVFPSDSVKFDRNDVAGVLSIIEKSSRKVTRDLIDVVGDFALKFDDIMRFAVREEHRRRLCSFVAIAPLFCRSQLSRQVFTSGMFVVRQ